MTKDSINVSIAIAGDHAGFDLKSKIINWLIEKSYEIKDFGPFDDASVDYPDFVHPLARAVAYGGYTLGILICGSGNGVCITANKYKDIRAAIAWNPELAQLAVQHNNANVLCLAARFTNEQDALEIVKAYLNAEFQGGRHMRRISKIAIDEEE